MRKADRETRKERRSYESPKLTMSAMIDVVFLLLIFFIVVTRPQDLYSRLGIDKKAPSDTPPPPDYNLKPQVRIGVYQHGYVVDGRRYSFDAIETKLKALKRFTDDQQVIITCHQESRHSNLVKLLDLCAKLEFGSLSLMSW